MNFAQYTLSILTVYLEHEIEVGLKYTFAWKSSYLKALIQPECLARVASWLAFVIAIFMGHENGDNKGQLRDDASKACWLNKSL